MEFVQIIEEYNHLWAVKYPYKEYDELTQLFQQWNDAGFLLDFFMENLDDLKSYFHIERISTAIEDTFEDAQTLEELILDFPYTENLDQLFKPLSQSDTRIQELSREKARNWDRKQHSSWLRIYAIRLEPNVYVVTGGGNQTNSNHARTRTYNYRIGKTQSMPKLFFSKQCFRQRQFHGFK
jgi:hypothetical protein